MSFPRCNAIHSSVFFKYVVHQSQCYIFFCLFQVCCSQVAMLYLLLSISSTCMLFTSGNSIPSSVYFKFVVHQWQSYTFCLFQVCCSPVAIIYLLSISSMLFTSGNHIPSVYFKFVVHQWQSYMYTFFCLFQVCCSPVAIIHVYILLSISSMLFTSGNVISSYCLKYAVHHMRSYTFFCLFQVCCLPVAKLISSVIFILLSVSSI